MHEEFERRPQQSQSDLLVVWQHLASAVAVCLSEEKQTQKKWDFGSLRVLSVKSFTDPLKDQMQ